MKNKHAREVMNNGRLSEYKSTCITFFQLKQKTVEAKAALLLFFFFPCRHFKCARQETSDIIIYYITLGDKIHKETRRTNRLKGTE